MTERSSASLPVTAAHEPVEPFSVCFTLTLDDYVETLLWMHRRPDMQVARTKRVVLLMVPVLILVIVAVFSLMGSGWRDPAPYAVIGGIFGALAGAFGMEALLRRWRVRRGVVQQLRATRGVDTSDGELRQPASVTLTPQGLESCTPSMEMRWPWHVLLGLDETDTMLLPRTEQARWIMIPKRNLSPETIDMLRRIIRQQFELSERGGRVGTPSAPSPEAS